MNIQKILIYCENCSTNFNADFRIPLLLPCGHTLCKKCSETIWKRLAYIKCPFDNKKHFNALKSLPYDYTILNLVKKYSDEYLHNSNLNLYISYI